MGAPYSINRRFEHQARAEPGHPELQQPPVQALCSGDVPLKLNAAHIAPTAAGMFIRRLGIFLGMNHSPRMHGSVATPAFSIMLVFVGSVYRPP